MKSAPRRLLFSLGLATLLVALILKLPKQENEPSREVSTPPPTSQVPLENQQEPPRSPVLGDQLLAQYGAPNGSLENDLQIFSRYLSNVFLLVKQRDPRHYATNKDLATFLLGQAGEPYLSPDSPILNQQGQLVDRLGSPLIIHPLSKDQIEIRCAGEDKTPYTADDLIL